MYFTSVFIKLQLSKKKAEAKLEALRQGGGKLSEYVFSKKCI